MVKWPLLRARRLTSIRDSDALFWILFLLAKLLVRSGNQAIVMLGVLQVAFGRD
jgi:hypothetical protein